VQGSRLNHKSLEQKRGFFVHLQWTYPSITPFLKGIHLTLDSWRPGRDSEGWKISPALLDLDMVAEWGLESSGAPEFVTAVPWLWDDLSCLSQLFQPENPPVRFVRSSKITLVTYGFGDASGEGFGSSFLLPDGTTLFRHGTWGLDADSPPQTSESYSTLSQPWKRECRVDLSTILRFLCSPTMPLSRVVSIGATPPAATYFT
jgi:hypothetical protein